MLFETTDEQREKLKTYIKEMMDYYPTRSRSLLSCLYKIARVDQGVFDLIFSWIEEDDPDFKEDIYNDLIDSIIDYVVIPNFSNQTPKSE